MEGKREGKKWKKGRKRSRKERKGKEGGRENGRREKEREGKEIKTNNEKNKEKSEMETDEKERGRERQTREGLLGSRHTQTQKEGNPLLFPCVSPSPCPLPCLSLFSSSLIRIASFFSTPSPSARYPFCLLPFMFLVLPLHCPFGYFLFSLLPGQQGKRKGILLHSNICQNIINEWSSQHWNCVAFLPKLIFIHATHFVLCEGEREWSETREQHSGVNAVR
jgi:hypothetical protein